MGLDLAPQLWDVFLHGCMALLLVLLVLPVTNKYYLCFHKNSFCLISMVLLLKERTMVVLLVYKHLSFRMIRLCPTDLITLLSSFSVIPLILNCCCLLFCKYKYKYIVECTCQVGQVDDPPHGFFVITSTTLSRYVICSMDWRAYRNFHVQCFG